MMCVCAPVFGNTVERDYAVGNLPAREIPPGIPRAGRFAAAIAAVPLGQSSQDVVVPRQTNQINFPMIHVADGHR
jgi:hypothetical protein